ncbi:MAG: hypothetical protein AB1782_01735 [Cyanobacteriota bacterium]
MRDNKAQEAVEFILITMLVFLGSLFVLLVFGNKIASFFTSDSSVAGSTNTTISSVNPSDPLKYNPDYNTKAINDNNKTLYENQTTTSSSDPDFSMFNTSNVNITLNSDGSASFVASNGQNVNIPLNVVENFDIVMETSGSEGVKKYLAGAMAYLIEQHAAEYPNGTVPVEISFGSSTRSYGDMDEGKLDEVDIVRSGTAAANIVSLTVGDDVIIFQHDQNCDASSGLSCGNYQILGKLVNGKLSGTITSNDESVNGKSISMDFKNNTLTGNLKNITYWEEDDKEWDDDNDNIMAWNINLNNTGYSIP